MSDQQKAPGGNTDGRGENARTSKTKVRTLQADRTSARDQDILPGALGTQLRAAYGELLSAQIPDQIMELVKQLDERQSAGRDGEPKDTADEEKKQ